MKGSLRSGGERLLRLPEVLERTGLRPTAVATAIKRGEFPAGVKLSVRSRAWPESSIDTWIAERIAAAKAAT